MENKELKIKVPEGYEIDVENSSFEKIVFKKKETKIWRDDKDAEISGYCISAIGHIIHYNGKNIPDNYTTFATKALAKSALAMARISQIMTNDDRFGGPITETEWLNHNNLKYCIKRNCRYDKGSQFAIEMTYSTYTFLAFHSLRQASLFKKENEDLIRDYYMIED